MADAIRLAKCWGEDNTHSLLKHRPRGSRGLVTVQLTESALVADEPDAALFLNGIKEHGFRVTLDDYGTGYSSIGYLRDFDFDIIKIDKSFIDGLDSAKQMGIVACRGFRTLRFRGKIRRLSCLSGCSYLQM